METDPKFFDTPGGVVGQPLDRVDGREKVTGKARYSAEFPLPGLLYGVLATSPIARGRIQRIDTAAALREPGVVAVLTHLNLPRLERAPNTPEAKKDTNAPMMFMPLTSDEIHYANQPVALVLADTWERAKHAATLLDVQYQSAPPIAAYTDPKAQLFDPLAVQDGKQPGHTSRGDAPAAMAAAPVKLTATFTHPVYHHNPMETGSTTAHWDAPDRLTVYESTQGVTRTQTTLSKMLGLPREQVRVVTKFLGGGFGCKGSCWPHTVLTVQAAKAVGRPVKIMLTRQQQFTSMGHREDQTQTLALGASREGKLLSLIHRKTSTTSPWDNYAEPNSRVIDLLYACPNFEARYDMARANVMTSTFTRAPGEAPGSFAIETMNGFDGEGARRLTGGAGEGRRHDVGPRHVVARLEVGAGVEQVDDAAVGLGVVVPGRGGRRLAVNQTQQLALAAGAQGQGLGLVFAVAHAGKLLLAREHDLHRPAHGLGSLHCEHGVGPARAFAAEAAAEELGDDPHLLAGQAQHLRQRGLGARHALRGFVHRQSVGGIPVGRGRARFHGVVVVNGVGEGSGELHWGSGHGGRGIAAAGVARLLAVLHRQRVEELGFGVGVGRNGRGGLILHVEQGSGVLSALPGVGQHQGHGLVGVVDFVAGQRHEHHGRIGVLLGFGRVGRTLQPRQVEVGEHRYHTRLAQSCSRIDALNASPGNGAGGQHAVQQTWQGKLGRVASLAGHFLAAIHAVQRLAHHAAGRIKEFRVGFHFLAVSLLGVSLRVERSGTRQSFL